MTDSPGGPPPGMPSAGPVNDRMQALLSRAVAEQVTEQRAFSSVLRELRTQVAALSEGIRLAASDASVERLGGVVSTVVADLRTSTSLLGQRIDAVATEAAAPTERAAVRLTALQADIAAQADSVQRMEGALDVLAGFPGALASLQRDVAGLRDRLQPLAEVRSALGDLGASTQGTLDTLGSSLAALGAKVDVLGEGNAPERVRDAIVEALTGRLDRLDEAADRPVVGPEVLRSGLGDLRASLDDAMGNRLEQLGAALGAVEDRLGQVAERVARVGDAAGGIPALASDLTRLTARVEELQGLHDKVTLVGQGVNALRDDSTGTTLSLGIASLRDDLVSLGERVAKAAPPPAEDVAGMVSRSVADRLVETLAPRIADVVLTRVSAALVAQLGEALSPRVKADTEAVVRTVTADSERRVFAHVDEAVLALAEALLRRRRGGRASGLALGGPAEQARASGAPGSAVSVAGTGAGADTALPDPGLEAAQVEGDDVGHPLPVVEPPVVPMADVVAAEREPVEPVGVEVAGVSQPPVGSPPSRPSVTTGLAPTFERAIVPVSPVSDLPHASTVPASVSALPVSPAAPEASAASTTSYDPEAPAEPPAQKNVDVNAETEPGLASQSPLPSISVTKPAVETHAATLSGPAVTEAAPPEPPAVDLADTGPDLAKSPLRSLPENRSEPVDADVPEAAPASAPLSSADGSGSSRVATGPPNPETQPSSDPPGSSPTSSPSGSAPHEPPVPARPLTAAQARSAATSVPPPAPKPPAPTPLASKPPATGPEAADASSAELDRSTVPRPEPARAEVRSAVSSEQGSTPPQLPSAPARPAKRKPWWRPGG